jgi:hypothetical protein
MIGTLYVVALNLSILYAGIGMVRLALAMNDDPHSPDVL